MNWQLLNKFLGMNMPQEAKDMEQMDMEVNQVSPEQLEKAKLLKEIHQRLNQSPKFRMPIDPNNLNTPGIPRA